MALPLSDLFLNTKPLEGICSALIGIVWKTAASLTNRIWSAPSLQGDTQMWAAGVSGLRHICRNQILNQISNHLQMWFGSYVKESHFMWVVFCFPDFLKNGFGLLVWTKSLIFCRCFIWLTICPYLYFFLLYSRPVTPKTKVTIVLTCGSKTAGSLFFLQYTGGGCVFKAHLTWD